MLLITLLIIYLLFGIVVTFFSCRQKIIDSSWIELIFTTLTWPGVAMLMWLISAKGKQ